MQQQSRWGKKVISPLEEFGIPLIGTPLWKYQIGAMQ